MEFNHQFFPNPSFSVSPVTPIFRTSATGKLSTLTNFHYTLFFPFFYVNFSVMLSKFCTNKTNLTTFLNLFTNTRTSLPKSRAKKKTPLNENL